MDDVTTPPPKIDLNMYRSPAAILEQQRRNQARIEQRFVEIARGELLLDQLRTYLVEPEVEWLVPEAWEWGEAGATGHLLGVPFRVVAGIDTLFLAQAVKPRA